MSNNRPLKVNAIPMKTDGYGMQLTFCDGNEARTVYRPRSGGWMPAPYTAQNRKYPRKIDRNNPFAAWDTETTEQDFINDPPAFTYVDCRRPKPLTPNFKTTLDTIEYLLKELTLLDVRTASGTAFFTHNKGSFSFPVFESSEYGGLTYEQVRYIAEKYEKAQ